MPNVPHAPHASGLSIAAHALAAVIGAAAAVGGIETMVHDLPAVMSMTLLLGGCLLPVLAWMSLRGSRASWSFTIAITSVFGVMTLFGAPKVRSLIGVPLAVAAIAPLVCIVAVALLSTLGLDYRGTGTSDK